MRNHLLISLGSCYISGLEYPAYVESIPVSFITDESGGQIAVVPLNKEVDHTKVYVNPNDDDDDKNEEEAAEKAEGNQTAVSLDVEDVEIMEIDDCDDKSDSNVDKMDDDDDDVDDDVDDDDDDGDNDYDDSDDDYSANDNDDDYDDEDDDDDDDDDMDDSDYEFIPKTKEKLLVEKKSTDDDTMMGEGDDREKQTVYRKRKPNIKEIAIVDADNCSGNSIFDVHLCLSVVSFFKRTCSYN